MSPTWKPENYNSVSVYIVAENAQRVIDFLEEAFNAAPLRRFDAPDGKIMHAEVRIDDTVVMIADASGAYPAFPVWLHFYVPDAQASYKNSSRRRRRLRSGTHPHARRPRPPWRRKRPLRQHLVDLHAIGSLTYCVRTATAKKLALRKGLST